MVSVVSVLALPASTNHQFAHRRGDDVGAAAMCDQMNVFDFRLIGDPSQHLLQMEDGEFARFPIIGIAEDSWISGRPGVNYGQSLTAEKMPELCHGESCVLEAVVIAVYEDEDVLARCQGQASSHFRP